MKRVDLDTSLPKMLLLASVFIFCIAISRAQPALPQRTVTVEPTQVLDFGTFYVTSAGTITVHWDGTVTTTGGVVSIHTASVKPAIFEVKLCQGRKVTITYAPTTISNGAPSLVLNVGPTEKGPSGATFDVNNNCNFITTLRVGGTLVVPGGSPPGTYTGSFPMTFTQE